MDILTTGRNVEGLKFSVESNRMIDRIPNLSEVELKAEWQKFLFFVVIAEKIGFDKEEGVYQLCQKVVEKFIETAPEIVLEEDLKATKVA